MNLTENLRDAGYIVIGIGVIGVQRAQVRRTELRQQIADQRAEARTRIAEAVKQAESFVGPMVKAVEAQVDAVAGLLPEQAKDLVAQARKAGIDARAQIRSRIAA